MTEEAAQVKVKTMATQHDTVAACCAATCCAATCLHSDHVLRNLKVCEPAGWHGVQRTDVKEPLTTVSRNSFVGTSNTCTPYLHSTHYSLYHGGGYGGGGYGGGGYGVLASAAVAMALSKVWSEVPPWVVVPAWVVVLDMPAVVPATAMVGLAPADMEAAVSCNSFIQRAPGFSPATSAASCECLPRTTVCVSCRIPTVLVLYRSTERPI